MDKLLYLGHAIIRWMLFLVANNHLITDKDMQVAFRLATPSGVTLSMKSLQGAVKCY